MTNTSKNSITYIHYRNAKKNVPSDYLHYWYSNYVSQSKYDITTDMLFFLSKHEILSQDIIKQEGVRYRNKVHFANQFGLGYDDFDTLVNAIERDQNFFSNILSSYSLEDRDSGNISAISNIFDINEIKAKRDISLAKIDKASDIISALTKPLTTFLTAENIKNYSEAVIAQYKEDNGINKEGKWADTKVAKQIIHNFLTQNKNEVFSVPKNIDQAKDRLNKSALRSLALIGAVNIALEGSNKRFNNIIGNQFSSYRQTGGKTVTVDSSKILQEFLKKAKGISNNVIEVGQTAAISQGSLDVMEPFIKDIDKFNKLKDSMIKSGTNSAKAFQCELNWTKNETFDKIAKLAGQNISKGTYRSHQKSDAGFRITQKDGNRSIEITLFGASLKNNLQTQLFIDGVKTDKYNVKLQQGTPLSTLLAREIGLSGKRYHGLIQALVSHSEISEDDRSVFLDNFWDRFKEYIKYKGLIFALRGYFRSEQALFVVIGDKIFTVENILRRVLRKDADSLIIPEGKGFSSREVYYSQNVWDSTPEERSDKAWSRVSSILYETKIKYYLIFNNLDMFSGI